MTAPLYLLDGAGAPQFARLTAGDPLVLDGDEGRHAATVRRTRVGERLDVADGAGRVAHCVVQSVGAGRLDLVIDAVEHRLGHQPRLVLVQALAKGGRDELAIETATELGVDAVIPWQAARSVVVWTGDRGRRAHGKWGSTVRAAAKQSRRAWLPEVRPLVTTAELAAALSCGPTGLLLHEEAHSPLAVTDLVADDEVWVMVGPEGGIEPAEVQALTEAGARAVRLGDEVLRSSSAGPAALAVLNTRLGRWG